jgi:hypothetical protein
MGAKLDEGSCYRLTIAGYGEEPDPVFGLLQYVGPFEREGEPSHVFFTPDFDVTKRVTLEFYDYEIVSAERL